MRRPTGRGDTLEREGALPLFTAGASPGGPRLTSADHSRLGEQFRRVRDLMADGAWRTLAQISEAVGAPEASVSARLRDLRKPEHGSRTVERRSRGRGLYEYRVAP